MANPLSFLNVLNGTETTQALLLNAACTVGGAFVPYVNAPISVAAATTTLTITQALHAGKIVQLQPTGGLAITLPAPTGTGNVYTFVVAATVTGGSLTIDAKGGDASAAINGSAYQFKSGTGLTVYSAGTTSNLITLNGTTTGGVIGDVVQLLDLATHQWILWDFSTQATGTVATPLSNH